MSAGLGSRQEKKKAGSRERALAQAKACWLCQDGIDGVIRGG